MSTNIRSDRLAKYLAAVLRENQEIRDLSDFKRFIDAILNTKEPCGAVERLVSNENALSALRHGLRFDITPAFINKYTSKFLNFLRKPEIKLLCNGIFLERILVIIVEPRTLWKSLLDAFFTRKLDDDATHVFCWLTTEVLSLPASSGVDITTDAQAMLSDGYLESSSSALLRNLGHKIKYLLDMRSSASTLLTTEDTVGGRHDNDFADFRLIAILPTTDELSCAEKPFYRRVEEIAQLSGVQRIAAHADNQFRLLREDMLSALREDIHVATSTKKKRRTALRLRGLSLANISCVSADLRYIRPCTIGITAKSGLEKLNTLSRAEAKGFLKNTPQYVKHRALGCFVRNTEIVAFATIERNLDDLLAVPPVVKLRAAGREAMRKTLLFLKLYDDVEFLVVDTATFAYEPILKCLQERVEFPFTEELFLYERGQPLKDSALAPQSVISELRKNDRPRLQATLKTTKQVTLDPFQRDSLLAGLTQRVSLIQGPPGTGKSFIGALLAKVLHDFTDDKILVMCYTNHALDQFLEDLLDIGIEASDIVRLGSKSTPRTEPLSLKEQKLTRKRPNSAWNTINALNDQAQDQRDNIMSSFAAYQELSANPLAILDYLEFEEPDYFEAFTVPEDEDGMSVVDKQGKTIKKGYLYERWTRGQSPDPVAESLPARSCTIWALDQKFRDEKVQAWKRALLNEQAESLAVQMDLLDDCHARLTAILGEKTREILKKKKIIGCTTTAAAMYADDLKHISPGIVLLEEAGEILESHVLTALSPDTKHLILIGDHLQLRPKINSYALSKEIGDGYDLNVSLFERLIHTGYPHITLQKQHRMCPEISDLVRSLTYPQLQDDEKTKTRPKPRGLTDRVIFINHQNPEHSFSAISDRRDEEAKQSKQNAFEAEIVLAIVKYLGQQGYGTDKLVVLTPYLGQLSLLRQTLSKQNDPVLNDLDSHDLVEAGLLSQASADYSKQPIKLSTIDNYQGEESDIVIASLTRSNRNGDVGFMAAPERLNVLLSRARNILIMVGNLETFASSRKGQTYWKPLFDRLKTNGHIYDGLPIKCEQHPGTTAILSTKEDFEREAPNGGCSAPCGTLSLRRRTNADRFESGAKLSCGIHECPSKCHKLADHSKKVCKKMVHRDCPRGHKLVLPCSTSQTSCRSCAHEDKIQKQKHDQDMRLEAERKRSQALYAQKLADLQSEASHLRRLNSDKSVESERARVLEQYSQEIKELRSSQCSIESTPSTQRAQETVSGLSEPRPRSLEPPAVGNLGSRSMTSRNEPRVEPRSQEGMPEQPVSKARDDWEYQKSYYNSQSPEIDTLMDMVGLEAVKSKFLTIKAKVDIAVRQDVDLSHERFGSILVGNPGTGKTTVARLYAKFLAAVGIIPGHKVIETTGSRLSNEGVPQCQKMVEQLLKDGGGVIFIDEAYQMVQGNNFGGSQVLDFLLAEVENLTGKIVFVLAGYQRPMEKFLAHNPGLPSRFPLELKFDDFDEAELLMIVRAWIERKWKRQMEVDGGLDGLYCRIVARRIARGRCQEGFANARAVENAMAKITERQTERLMKQKRQGGSPVNELFLDKEDMIGPEPSQRLKSSKAWQKLQGMIGLAEVKKTVESLIDTIQYNYRRELDELAVVGYNLNKVFLGNPGTGKTSVARIYGQILVDIGLLSNGEVVVKNPSDFIGAVMGESEKNTKGILAATLGKVLVIDEAYGLSTSGSSDGAGARSDPYRSAVIDTIVAEVQSAPGDNQCVLLLGYKDQMEQMFQAVNPGLSRRFPIDQAFIFEDFSAQELGLILDLKLSEQGYSITDQARQVALEMLERARNRPHFGNAGEIDILLNIAKLHHQGRISSNGLGSRALDSVLDAVDFDENFDRVEKGEFNMKKLFEGVVGCESIISTLEGYQNMVKRLRELHMDPREQVPFNFVFRGPPGTGKTSTARKMGQVYYNMGLLSSVEVIEASATDLVGQFVGQTGPKTQKLLERGLGKVLFIDEAYRLAEGHFAKEAMDELVDCITKPRFAKKVIIILAGYDADINRLMTINTGLTSRFPDSFQFKSLSPQDCIELLNKLLKKQKETIYSTSGVNFNISCLDDSSFDYHRRLTDGFDALSRTASWANARDVETLAKAIFGKTIKTSQSLCGAELALSRDTVTEELHDMLVERRSRGHLLTESSAVSLNHKKNLQVCIESPQPQSEESQSLKSNVKANDQAYAPVQKSSDQQGLGSGREAGVTDEDWIQLEKDKVAAKQDEKDYLRMTEEMEKQTKELLSLKEKETQAARAVEEARQQQNERLRVRFEQERVRCKMERRRQEAIARELEIKRQTLAEARRKDQATQAKLRSMGVCVQGYRWIKRPGGYKCEGGGHFVPNSQLE